MFMKSKRKKHGVSPKIWRSKRKCRFASAALQIPVGKFFFLFFCSDFPVHTDLRVGLWWAGSHSLSDVGDIWSLEVQDLWLNWASTTTLAADLCHSEMIHRKLPTICSRRLQKNSGICVEGTVSYLHCVHHIAQGAISFKYVLDT